MCINSSNAVGINEAIDKVIHKIIITRWKFNHWVS